MSLSIGDGNTNRDLICSDNLFTYMNTSLLVNWDKSLNYYKEIKCEFINKKIFRAKTIKEINQFYFTVWDYFLINSINCFG